MKPFAEFSGSTVSSTREAPGRFAAVRRGAPRGFALVVALSLMSFVMLLLLSLTSLVRVGTEASLRQVDVIEARQNALLSMQVALGKLQQYTGSDQRVTALSGSLQGGPSSEGGSIQPGSRHWVGVWDADEDSDTYGSQLGSDSGEEAGPEWLLSGGDELDPSSDDPVALSGVATSGAIPVSNAAKYALLLGPGDLLGSSGTANRNDFVVAPVESIGPAGGIAWWVSDEGQKAKIMGDRHEENYENLSDKEANILKLIAPQRNGLDAIAGLQAFERGSGIGFGEISKMSGLGDAALLGAGEGALLNSVKSNYHALSLHSQGVLADVREGGLKKDLTHEFHTAVSGNRLRGEQVFDNIAYKEGSRRAQVKEEDDPGGPFWDQLRSYANTKPVSDVIDFQPQTDLQYGVMPIVTQIKVYYHAFWTQYENGEIGLRFVILPHLVLNNPYPYSLRMPDTYFQILHGPTSNDSPPKSENRLDPGFAIFGVGGYFADPPYSSPAASKAITSITSVVHPPGIPVDRAGGLNGHKPRYITYRIRGYTFPPGATRAFSPIEGLQPLVRVLDDSDPGQSLNTLAEGDRAGSGFFIDVPDSRFTLDDLEANSGAEDSVASKLNNLPSLQITGYQSNDIHLVFGTGTKAKGSGSVVTNPFKIIYRLGAWGLGQQYNPGPYGPIFTMRRPESDLSPLVTDSATPSFGFDHSLRLTQNYIDTAQFPDQGAHHKIPWLAHYNPAATFSMRSPYDWPTNFVGGFINNPSYVGGTLKHGDDYTVWGADMPRFGAGDNIGGNQTILFDLPTKDAPLTSIGQLMHANPSRNFDFDFNEDGEFLDDMLDSNSYDEFYFAGNIHPAYAIGNSLANGKIPDRDGNRDGKSDTYLSWKQMFRRMDENGNARRGVHYDYSYLLNEALWDKYFFSAIDFDEGGVTSNFPHTNSRLLLHGDPEDGDFTGSGFDKSAAHLVLDGAFNVNSTSKEAWKAVLASFINVGNSVDGAVSMEASLQRMIEPIGSVFGGGDTALTPNSYTGFRRLSEMELDLLAEEIVKVIRLRMAARGSEKDRPFLSLSEFINRRLDSKLRGDEALVRMKGALQAAIDESQLNGSMDSHLVEPASSRNSPREESHSRDYIARNITTYLSQADLLARLGSVLSARSDTFVIRSYGDVRDPVSGEINSKAWCEAVVQRMPEYVSLADAAEVHPDDLSDEDNRQWGRRYEVVSMRWLTAEDIFN